MKFIIITGGVISGIGKGVSAASIGFFLSEKYKIIPIKLDGYLNVDPGTMNPKEHGEVFVLEDGAEVDMDFGHYERFLGQNSNRSQSITMGKIFKDVLERERQGDYLGQTVQLIPHVTNFIQDKIKEVTKNTKTDICIIEIGGTVGDIENELFIEAIRQMRLKEKKKDFLHIHLTYAPIPAGVKEQKTKPTQQSINLLHAKGLFPDFVFVRGEIPLTNENKAKIALFSNLEKHQIISVPDVDNIYKIPEILAKQNFDTLMLKHFGIKERFDKKLKQWGDIIKKEKNKSLIIGIIGKYTGLEDSYSSVVEALRHSGFQLGVDIKICFFDARKEIDTKKIKALDGIIVPGGFGTSGIEEMIRILEFTRKNKIPSLGICLGLQLMIIEFTRNVLGVKNANSKEFDEKTKAPIITLLDSQANIINKGGTMRLGAQRSILKKGKIFDLYKTGERIGKDDSISERFRHRYEVNPEFVKSLNEKGLYISGISEKEGIVQFIELDKKNHPYFVGTQSHPELTSRLENPAPLFMGLITACLKNK
ncbi:CTP synthase (glutamine hydrolyzing) [Candidatus Gracilibacteria bacterium]|nr:CTP synthase (glutamine hydrolyzing) [Candidatus Gracilibacteria bacterium]NUJ98645.1 CTP synthase (glutamine hydrolyzing) [Candidatus Gracilibacteria bacterium]